MAPDHQKAKDIYKKAKQLKQKKEEGNAVFKSANWSAAFDLYSEALKIDPCNRKTNAKLYFNRAIVAAKVRTTDKSLEKSVQVTDTVHTCQGGVHDSGAALPPT